MPDSYREKIYAKYVDTYTQTYKQNLSKEYPRRKRLYDFNYKSLLPESPMFKIAELGCGPGFFLKYLEENGYKNCIGVDRSPQQIAAALELGVTQVVQSNIFSFLRDTGEPFDIICAFHVIEHLYKDEILELMELINTRLSPSGIVLLEVPNAGSPLLGGSNRYSEFTHEVGFTPSSLREIMLVSDFYRVQVYPVKDTSPYARLFFGVMNYFLHSRFAMDAYFEGGLIGIGYKKN